MVSSIWQLKINYKKMKKNRIPTSKLNIAIKAFVLSTILVIIITSSTEGQNKKGEDLLRHYRQRVDSLDSVLESRAKEVLIEQDRCVGVIYLKGRITSSSLSFSNDSLFIAENKNLFCVNIETGEKYWSKRYGYSGNKKLLNTKPDIIIRNVKIKGIDKKTGELVWTNDKYHVNDSRYNEQKDLVFLTKDSTIVGLDASTGEKRWESIRKMPFNLLMTKNNFLIGKSKDTLFCINLRNKKTLWKQTVEDYARVNISRNTIIIESRNDSIFKLKLSNGKVLFGNHREYKTDILNLILSSKGLIKKKMGEEGIFLEDVKSRKIKWIYEIPNNENLRIPFSKRIGVDRNTLYVNTEQGKLRAINLKNGKLLWEFDTYSYVTSNIVIANGVLYLVNITGQVIAIDTNLKDGVRKWTNLRDFE